MPFFFGALCSDSCLLVLLLGLFSGLSSEPVELWGEKTTFNGHPRANTQSSTRATERNGHPATPAPQPRSTQWSLHHQTRFTRAVQAPGHRQQPPEAEILCLELSPEEGFTPGQLVQRAPQPSLRVIARQVTTLQRRRAPLLWAVAPASCRVTGPGRGRRVMVTMQGCWSGDHTCPHSLAAWLRTGAQVVV